MGFSSSLAAALALGLAWVQGGSMILGFLGLLRAGWVVAWIAIGGVLASWAARSRASWPECRPDLSVGALVAAGLLLGVYSLMAAVPPWYRDSMVYHLALPREFAVHGGYVRPDDNIFASFPLGYESILAALHAFGAAPDRFPPFNPRLVGVWVTGGAALATTGLARRAGASSRTASWAGVLLLLVPTMVEFGPSAYVEPYLLLLGTLATGCVVRVSRDDKASLLPAGFFAGLAASVKYPGLAIVAILAVLLLLQGLGRGEERARCAVRYCMLFVFVAALVGSPFYIRNIVERGNPVFPLAFDLLGGQGWDHWRAWAYDVTLSHYGAGRDSASWILLPFRLFSATDMLHGFEGSIGPAVVVGLAGFLIRRGTAAVRPTGLLLAFASCWFVFWALTVQQARFFLIAIPTLLALSMTACERFEFARRGASRLATAILVAVALAWALAPIRVLWKRQFTSDWLAGRVDRTTLLSRLLPESFALEADLESLVPAGGRVWLVWTREHTYYLRRDYRLDSVFEAYRFEALLDEDESDTAIVATLAREGITHILINEKFFLVDQNAELRPGRTDQLRARFREMQARALLVPQASWKALTLFRVNAP